MALPGFTADFSLPASVSAHRTAGVSPALDHAGKVVPQQLPPCLQSCQQSWSNCIGRCSWWEWAIGSCIPKCRAEWVVCLGQRC